MHMYRLLILPVEVGEQSAGKASEELGLRKRLAGRSGAGWEPAGSWRCRGELAEAGSRGWGPWGRQGEQAVLADPPTPRWLCDSNPQHDAPSQI